MKHQSRFRACKGDILMTLVAMAAVSLTGIAALASGQSTPVGSKEIKNSLPPIDTTAPSKFETASFGLG